MDSRELLHLIVSPAVSQDSIGTILKNKRIEQELKVEAVAEVVGISVPYIYQIESGEGLKKVKLQVIQKYAEHLGMDLTELSLKAKLISLDSSEEMRSLLEQLNTIAKALENALLLEEE